MACNRTKGKATLLHDLLALALHRAIRCAVCVSSAELGQSSLAAHPSGDPGLWRGNITAFMHGDHVAVCLLCRHTPCCPALLGTLQTAGFAAARIEQAKQGDF